MAAARSEPRLERERRVEAGSVASPRSRQNNNGHVPGRGLRGDPARRWRGVEKTHFPAKRIGLWVGAVKPQRLPDAR